MSDSLKGRRILVTGAASGIGRAAATLFESEGAQVAWLDVAEERLAACNVAEGSTRIPCDLADPEAIARAVPKAAEMLGGLDGILNSAGIADTATLDATELDAWNRVIAINLTAPMLVCRTARAALDAAGGGSIVNIASASGLRPANSGAAYSASKAGVIMLTRSLATEWAPKIRANAVCPGTVDTPMLEGLFERDAEFEERIRASYPLQRLASAEEIAEAALYLISDRSSFVTGIALAVDGGRTLH
ncbi:SDR family NAD(P)-dependent oxidoreductase [Tropicimonas isoalkanivorans]|uniref:NAD(P)-dependent dehydrogenase, short-chain alcohol dehydrogenase family n=1 Tax=Tropicimonas isoalkanivorans TaxID=441112 RepID=A0A1I1HWZ1_9RHOB|nr:SDR family NAD(P)-dependent oxidoreductase [Tropicimonas isoalkanivorans]SFC28082.1 NAD(P)-dependent dehydrogenase, short-chain alcohol dehydrogenase family [Tropicimonas isoalkanivorans]